MSATPASTLFGVGKNFDPYITSLFSTNSKLKQVARDNATLNALSDAPQHQRDNGTASVISSSSIPKQDEPIPPRECESIKASRQSEYGSSRQEQGLSIPIAERKRKRKRSRDTDNLEAEYLHRLAVEDIKEAEQRLKERLDKRQRVDSKVNGTSSHTEHAVTGAQPQPSSDEEMDADGQDSIPTHESQSRPKGKEEQEKASRTVFLGNVSTEAITSKPARKILVRHISSIFNDMAATAHSLHKVESIRFRSTAYEQAGLKRAAFAKKELMDTTTKSTNAYAVYSSKACAREAARRLNGSVVLGRHIRVDEVAHPAKVDNHRCVFIGNIGFVDDESQIKKADEQDNKSKSKTRLGDTEEGLWQQFGKAGLVESVRVIRDPKSRDPNSVEAALLYNDKKYPPLLPRKLRVVRAKNTKSKDATRHTSTGNRDLRPTRGKSSDSAQSVNMTDSKEKSFKGRARKMSGQAGAASLNKSRLKPRSPTSSSNPVVDIKRPEAFVFEGHRASSTQGNRGLRLGGAGRRKGKRPETRSTRRAAAWKSKGNGGKPLNGREDASHGL
ncbi:MAG: Nucleolar protein 12 [Chrysothrix sp. TS-e1954]|nr:MAG: Nucleolar protein 12 [Chrysothrix sp. TS-e1954]